MKPESVLSRTLFYVICEASSCFPVFFFLFANVTAGLIVTCCNLVIIGSISEQEVLFNSRQ